MKLYAKHIIDGDRKISNVAFINITHREDGKEQIGFLANNSFEGGSIIGLRKLSSGITETIFTIKFTPAEWKELFEQMVKSDPIKAFGRVIKIAQEGSGK